MSDLPPPLLIEPGGVDDPREVEIYDLPGLDRSLAETFGATLARARDKRSLASGPLKLYGAGDPLRTPPEPDAGHVWVPHMFCWRVPSRGALAWEHMRVREVEGLLGVSAATVSLWAQRPALILRLVADAGSGGRCVLPGSGEEYLSFRWVMRHEHLVARTLARRTAVGHISLHVDPTDESNVVEVLTGALGLVEISRPAAITIPGRWFASANTFVHLNFRQAVPHEPGFPGTAPNHLCFSVEDLAAVEKLVKESGYRTERAGSLAEQVWFRLPGGTFIELQPNANH